MKIVKEVSNGLELLDFANDCVDDFEYGDYDAVFDVLSEIEKESGRELTLQYAKDVERIKKLITEVNVYSLVQMFGEDEEYWEQMLDDFGARVTSHRTDIFIISREAFRRMIFIYLKNNYNIL